MIKNEHFTNNNYSHYFDGNYVFLLLAVISIGHYYYYRTDKIDRFIRVYYGTRYLAFFGGQKYDFIYNRIRYLIGVKYGITYVMSHNLAKS